MDRYTTYGYWADTSERYGQTFVAASARHAEELMQEQAENEGGIFRAAGTLLGEHRAADTYTAFVDPDDARNTERGDLEPAFEELGLTGYTVLGVVVSTRRLDHGWNERTGGERWLSHELATSPRYAEDIARSKVAERGHFELRVCAVLAGTKNRCESLVFSDPDERAAA
jgi:hypothetical protein